MKENKVLHIILTCLNYFFFAFAKFFEGVGFVLRKIGKGIKFVFSNIKKFFKMVFGYIGKGFSIGYSYLTLGLSLLIKYTQLGFKKLVELLSKITFLKKFVDWCGHIQKKIADRIRHNQRKVIWGIVFIMPLMVGFVYFFLLPFITTIVYSFSNVYTPGTVTENNRILGIVSEYVGLDNYKYIWNVHATFKGTLWTVFKSTLSSAVLILVFSLIMAVVLNSQFKGRAFVRAIFFMPVIFNSQAVDIAVNAASTISNIMEQENGGILNSMFNFNEFLLNTSLPVSAVNFLSNASNSIFTVISYSGVQILLFLAGIQSVPKHLYEAAKIEGATQYEIFWKITFPMVSPLMLTAGVYTVVDSFMTSELITLMKKFQVPGHVTYTLGLGNLTNDGIYAAMSILFFLIGIATIALVVLVIRPLVFYYDE